MKTSAFNLSLRNLTYRLRRFKEILDEELKDIMLDNEDIIIGMVQEQLYNQGINGRNKFIADYAPYAPRTIKNKKRKGQPYDRVTLRDTGKFYNSMKLRAVRAGFGINATDPKADDLIEKYGSAILRLTNENLSILLWTYVRPELVRRLKNKLHED